MRLIGLATTLTITIATAYAQSAAPGGTSATPGVPPATATQPNAASSPPPTAPASPAPAPTTPSAAAPTATPQAVPAAPPDVPTPAPATPVSGQAPGANNPAQPGVAEDVPSALLLVMDASHSMTAKDGAGQTKLAAAKQALNGVVDALPDGVRVGLRVYGHRTSSTQAEKSAGCRDTELIVPVQALQRQQMKGAIAQYQASGWTPIGTSLMAAAQDLPPTGERTVILVSDGIDTCAPPDPCEAAQNFKAQGIELKIHTIGFQADAKARAQLECIAKVTGGSYHDAADAASLGAQMKQLSVSSVRAMRTLKTTGNQIKGAPSYRDAPALQTGMYQDTILPKEELWYAVKLEQGQDLVVKASLDRSGSDDSTGRIFEVQLVDPILKEMCCKDDKGFHRGYKANISDRTILVGARTGAIGKTDETQQAGTYYIRVKWDEAPKKPVQAPLELSIEIAGPG